MAGAFIVSALRTAGGKRNGRLSGWHPTEMAAEIIDGLLASADCDPALIEDVVMGCVSQVGEQASNIARMAVLASRLPLTTPGTSVDRQCGSSQQALHFAAQAVMSGSMDVAIAAGVESMSRVPMFTANTLPAKNGMGTHMGPRLVERFGPEFSQFTGAEMMARKYGLSRAQLDEYALSSHRRATAATQAGRFKAEILPIEARTQEGRTGEMHLVDEGIRANASLEQIGSVKLLQEGGVVSAANASQICDGASGVLVVNERGLKALGNVKPLARIHQLTVLGDDPVMMLEAPIPATGRALAKAGLRIEDIDLFEVNEAFASVPLAWLKATGADPARLNVHGGAIALGHPLGASGTKLMATLVHALQQTGGRYGLQTACEAGGMANVTIVERL